MTFSTTCNSGYQSEYCSVCSDQFYRLAANCVSCASHEGSSVAAAVIVAVLFFGIITLGVILFNDNFLDSFVASLMTFQQIIQIGNHAAQYFSPGAQRGYMVLNMILFDFDFIRPGCSIGITPYPMIYVGYIVVVLIFVIIFVCGAFLRGYILYNRATEGKMNLSDRTREYLKQNEITNNTAMSKAKIMKQRLINTLVSMMIEDSKGQNQPWFAMSRRRAVRSCIILLAMVYFIFCVKTLQMINCKRLPDGLLHLVIEYNIECYKGEHQRVAAIAWIILFVYVLGFPLVCFWKVFKSRGRKFDHKMMSRYGFLLRGLKENFFWFRITTFAINFAISLETVFMKIGLEVFVSALFFLVNWILIVLFKPFLTLVGNILVAASGIGRGFYLLILLAAIMKTEPSDQSLFVAILVIFLVTTVVLAPAVFYYERKKLLTKGNQDNKQLEDTKENNNQL
eukprot:TRINITY_DN7087_c0_g1_i1.p1 TRINITY_DN7087_c0_g1~~TRINITY_DN7087_c0_g1_i1.p1  ORF type:complete len:453 (-),score=50.11 TRINITY_DN7087_c0_g1_i1:63-1421(-)